MKMMIFFLFLLVLTPWPSTSARADERKVITSIAAKQEYSDNLYWSSASKKSGFISTLSPALEVIDNTERLKARLKLQLDGLYYFDNTDLNTIDQDYSGNLRYAVSSRTSLSTAAGYIRDSVIDSGFEETGLLQGNATRDRYTYQLGGDYALSEITGLGLQYGYNRDSYDSSDYDDYTSHTVNLSADRDLSELLSSTVGRINLGVARYDTESSKVTSYSGTLGGERSVDERFSYFADIGLNYTRSTFSDNRLVPSGIPGFFLVETYEDEADTTGFTGKAGMTYRGERTNGTVFVSHGLTAASGQDGTVERTLLQGNVGRRLNETSRLAFGAGYAINKGSQDELAADRIDEQSLWLRPAIIYTLTDRLALESSYNYSWVHDKVDDTEVNRSLVMVKLIFAYTVFE